MSKEVVYEDDSFTASWEYKHNMYWGHLEVRKWNKTTLLKIINVLAEREVPIFVTVMDAKHKKFLYNLGFQETNFFIRCEDTIVREVMIWVEV